MPTVAAQPLRRWGPKKDVEDTTTEALCPGLLLSHSLLLFRDSLGLAYCGLCGPTRGRAK